MPTVVYVNTCYVSLLFKAVSDVKSSREPRVIVQLTSYIYVDSTFTYFG